MTDSALLWQAGEDLHRHDGGWRLVADGVMGGLSRGTLSRDRVQGRDCLRMAGQVRLENNGGFIQINRDLLPHQRDASGYHGLVMEVCGNGQRYGLHLKTGAVNLPWQSYRAGFEAPRAWSVVRLPFADFAPHRLSATLDISDLRRIAVVAIGRPFEAEIYITALGLYQDLTHLQPAGAG